jgi:hypothetical protein
MYRKPSWVQDVVVTTGKRRPTGVRRDNEGGLQIWPGRGPVMMFVPGFRRGSMASTARRGLGDLSKEVALLGAGSLVLVALRTLDRVGRSVVGVVTEL